MPEPWISRPEYPFGHKIRVEKLPEGTWILLIPRPHGRSLTSFKTWQEAHNAAFQINDFRNRDGVDT